MPYRAHWIALFAVITGSFIVLAGYHPHIRSAAPPVPERVATADGRTLFEAESIWRGQNVWQSIGGQEVGSVCVVRAAPRRHRRARLVPRRSSRARADGARPRRGSALRSEADPEPARHREVLLDRGRAPRRAGPPRRRRGALRGRGLRAVRDPARRDPALLGRAHLAHALGIFWIATAWLATGLYVGPAVSGVEPRGQRALVNVLFLALLVIVVGSLAGQWLSIMQRLPGDGWFWFGHQGYEYVDLGRAWQILLFVGLFLWLFLMLRALWPALRRPSSSRPLLFLFVLSSAAIALFYGAGLLYGRRTNLAVAEYWRWWVVHLWVEGFFEVFATVVIAFLFVRLRLLHVDKATRATFFSTTIFLAGGILGTFHHLYFSGTPASVTALGAAFSALEVVPLALVGLEVWQNIRLARARSWLAAYRWPIAFFVSVAFWNLVGAGLFGFFINPPIALYFMQGLNTTPVHGHTALFGVYGMLGIGLMLFCLRALRPGAAWRTRPVAASFWLINVGLGLMVVLSLLPVGILQTWAAVETGTWWARSAEFMQQPVMNLLRWLRLPGDTIFAIGALVLGWFVLGLATGWSLERTHHVHAGSTEVKEGADHGPGPEPERV